MGARLFARLFKVDEERREVWGRATQEVPDRSGEIMDYESSKPYFKAWSDTIRETSGGKSLGNIRAMHGKTAAGKIIALNFNDDERAIDIGTKIVDDNEWGKVLEGVYTGFSIGGDYVDKWKDPANKKLVRFTANPCETSLVDFPDCPSATFFDVVKAGGTVMRKAFKAKEKTPKEGEYGSQEDAGYADQKNDKYPLKLDGEWNEKRIKAAWSYIHMPKNREGYSAAELETIESRIVAAWKKKIDPDGPPSASDKAAMGALAKGMWDVSNFADMLQRIAWLTQGAEAEAAVEGDGSPLPQKLKAWLADGAAIFEEMSQEELQEMLDGLLIEGETAVEVEETLEAFARGGAMGMEKKGSKFSKETAEKLDGIHKDMEEVKGHLGKVHKMHEAACDKMAKLGYKAEENEEQEDPNDEGGEHEKGANGDLQKMLDGALSKAVKAATEPLLAKIEALEKGLQPPKVRLGAASKTDDDALSVDEEAELRKRAAEIDDLPPDLRSLELIKAAQRGPGFRIQ